ncbi:MAG: ZIP family metal transporter, partial [bacterium]
MDWFKSIDQVWQALFATTFTWLLTAAGASLVFIFKSIKQKVLDAMLGFAAGVMIAASFWSLLAPSIEMSEKSGHIPWVPPLIGFLSGGILLFIVDKILPHLHLRTPESMAEGIHTKWKRSVLVILAITIHNIPEGL